MVSPLIKLPGLRVDERKLWLEAFSVWLTYSLDFPDAYNGAYMRARGVKEIYSWDKGFDDVLDIVRIDAGDGRRDDTGEEAA